MFTQLYGRLFLLVQFYYIRLYHKDHEIKKTHSGANITKFYLLYKLPENHVQNIQKISGLPHTKACKTQFLPENLC